MKRLITKNQIPNAGGMVGQATSSKVTMAMTAFNHVATVNYLPPIEVEGVMEEQESRVLHTVEASFIYKNEDGVVIPTPTNGKFDLPREGMSIEVAYDLIKDGIDPLLSFAPRFEAEVLAVAKLQMAQTLGISPVDILEII